MNWKDNIPPLDPENFSAVGDSENISLSWSLPGKADDGEVPYYFVLYRFKNSQKINLENPQDIIAILNGDKTSYNDKEVKPGESYTYIITSLDRLENESKGNQSSVVTVK